MKLAFHLLVALSLALATPRSAPAEQPADEMLSAMPADVGYVIIVERPALAMPEQLVEPFLKAFAPDGRGARPLLDALRHVPGGFAIGIIPPPRLDWQKDAGIIFCMKLDRPETKFEDWFEKELFPALLKTAGPSADSGPRIEHGDGNLRVVAGRSGDLKFMFTTKGKLAFGSNKASRVLRWRQGEFPKSAWIKMPGVRRTLRKLPEKPGLRAVLNPAAFADAMGKQKPNSWEEIIWRIINLRDIQSVAMDLGWQKRTVQLHATASLAKECKGAARFLARPSSESKYIGVIPEDFVGIARFGWSSGQSLIDAGFEMTDLFDPTISQEYREDLAAFKQKSGIDLDAGLLGQLVDELIVGVRVDFTKKIPIGWAAVAPLAKPEVFSRQIEQVFQSYGLKIAAVESQDIEIKTLEEGPAFSFAIVKNLLILADSPETVGDVAKRAAQKKLSRPAGKNLATCYAGLASANQWSAIFDFETLCRKAPFIPFAAGPKLGPVIARGTIGLAAHSADRTASLDLIWDFGRPPEAEPVRPKESSEIDSSLVAVIQAATDGMVQARHQAERMVGMVRMRGLGQSLVIYADSHKGEFPPNLEQLARAMPDAVPLDSLASPYDQSGPKSIEEVNEKAFVIYRPGLNSKSPPDEILLADRTIHMGEGANFLFVDGHVEFIAEPRAGELIDLMKTGAESIKR